VDVAEHARALHAFLVSQGFAPSGRCIARTLRDLGLEFREETVRAALRDATGTQSGRRNRARGTQSGRSRDATSRERADHKGMLKLLPAALPGLITPSLRSGVAGKPAVLADWAELIQRRVLAMNHREIRTLDHREMHDVASWHVVRFQRSKSKTEAMVRKTAVGLVGRIRNVVTAKDHPALHDLTVLDYFAFGAEVWEAGARTDWDYPWAVVAWAEAPDRQDRG
jgi:hypothetical protein